MIKPVTETISVRELQAQIGSLARLVGNERKHIKVATRGLEFAVIIPISDYQELLKLAEKHRGSGSTPINKQLVSCSPKSQDQITATNSHSHGDFYKRFKRLTKMS